MSAHARSSGGTFRRLVTLALVSGLAGILVVGLALPFATGLGWVARESATGFQELSSEVELGALPERSRVVEADGSTLATFYSENRTYMPLHKVSGVMLDATIAIEDHRFYEHGPIDMKGTLRAFIGNVEAGEVTAGGSTLTQQYAKLLRRSQAETEAEAAAATEESYSRKLSELRLAIDIESELSKDDILERYINIAYYGASVYGVEEAANRYFSTTAAELTLPQAAMLAGLVQRPSGYDPTQDPEAALERRNVVINRMAELEMITAEEAAAARQSDLGLEISPARNGCSATWTPFYCEYVRYELEGILAERADTLGASAEDLLYQGGLTVETTLERRPQVAAQEAIADWVAPEDDSAAALASVEPGTGAIKALAHSRNWGDGEGETHFNYAVDRAFGGGNGFQPGSTFKPLVAAAAFSQGISVNTPIKSPPELDMRRETIQTCDGPPWSDSSWEPGNYPGSPSGTMSLRSAMEKSVNTYFIQLVQQTGLCDPWTIAHQSGVRNADGSPLNEYGTLAIGGMGEVSPLSVAQLYAMFAARGVHCEPYAITRVIGRDGEVLYEHEPECNRVLEERVADAVTDLLRGVIETPGATGNNMRLEGGRPAAGKTGTNNQTRAVWWAGYTPQLSTAVALSDPDPPEGDEARTWTLEGRTFNGKQLSVCGGCIPGPIWKQMMDAALADEQVLPFVPADRNVLQGQTSRVPDVRGMELQEAQDALTKAGFRVNGQIEQVQSEVPGGQVVETDPSPWSWLTVGSEIRLTVSQGDQDDEECRPIPFLRECDDDENGDGGGGGGGGGGPGNGGGPGGGDGGDESDDEDEDLIDDLFPPGD